MSIDSQTDAPLAAVAALVRGAITADLGADFIAAVYNDPRPIEILASGKIPSLNIYGEVTVARRRNSVALVRDRTIQFDYLLPATSLERRAQRWPALEAVWTVITNVLSRGKHPALSSGAAVLEAAGICIEQESSLKARFGVADGGGQTYPFMRGTVVLTFTPDEVDVATLNDFLLFHMAFDEPGKPSGGPDGVGDDDVVPLIELNVTLPPFGS